MSGLALYALFLVCYVACSLGSVAPVGQSARHPVSIAPLVATLKVATPLYIICLISFLCNALTWTGAGLAFYAAGVERGIFYCARILLLGWFSIFIANSISLIKFSAVFKWFLWPLCHLKVPVESVSMAAAIAIRFIPEIYIEFQAVKEAQWCRGAATDQGNVLVRTRAYCGCFLPLLVRMLVTSEELACALDSRCWGARVVPPCEDLPRITAEQVAITAAVCILLVAITILF